MCGACTILTCCTQGARMGIDLIVVDDGWFGRRENDRTSLGDWVPSPFKFPSGMRGLAQDVNDAGCRLGLWFEPEMVSEDSVSES